MNVPAVVAANTALENPSYVEDYVKEVMEVSKPLLESFLKEKGVDFWPSAANFILIKPADQKACVDALKDRGILVRPRSGSPIDGTVRMTIGPKEETERLIAALEEILPAIES